MQEDISGDERDVARVGNVLIGRTEYRVIEANVDIIRIGRELSALHIRDVCEIPVRARGHYIHTAVAFGFVGSFFGELTRDDVIGLAGFHKVQRHR